MIDLNCNLLPGETRGADEFAESLRICQQSVEDGVETIVATARLDTDVSVPQQVAVSQPVLEKLGEEMGDALSLKFGFVVKFQEDLALLLERYGRTLTLAGGRYLLVSMPAFQLSPGVETVWSSIREQGFSAIISRPECSSAIRRDASRLDRWMQSGVMLQLDAASVIGAHGREAQRFSVWCAREYEGRVAVASNARTGKMRHSSLRLAHEELTRKSGTRRAELLLRETPAAIINLDVASDDTNKRDASRPSFISRLRTFRLQKGLSSAS